MKDGWNWNTLSLETKKDLLWDSFEGDESDIMDRACRVYTMYQCITNPVEEKDNEPHSS